MTDGWTDRQIHKYRDSIRDARKHSKNAWKIVADFTGSCQTVAFCCWFFGPKIFHYFTIRAMIYGGKDRFIRFSDNYKASRG